MPSKKIEVVAAIILRERRIFATQRGYGEWKDWWEFPGGKIEPGESTEDALRREIREELTTEIKVGESLTTEEYDYPNFTSRCIATFRTIICGQLQNILISFTLIIRQCVCSCTDGLLLLTAQPKISCSSLFESLPIQFSPVDTVRLARFFFSCIIASMRSSKVFCVMKRCTCTFLC